jgi:hypothetical protein
VARHVGEKTGLIEKDQAGRIDGRYILTKADTLLGNIRPLLLTRVKGLFLSTRPWRCNARQTLDALIGSPVRAVNASAYSVKVASFFSATNAFRTAPSFSSNTEAKPRP